MRPQFIFIYVTTPNKKLAIKISKLLLKKELIACSNIIQNMESIYKWRGNLCHAKEVILLLKTTRSNFKKIENVIKSVHSYECPCIVALPLIEGEKTYLGWIMSNSKGPKL